jgi:twitching motility protein PilU
MEYGIQFAETGHLCLATLHANSANQALDRVINFFPEDKRDQLLMDMSLNVKGIIAQRLLPRSAGVGRIAAMEIMLASPLISDLIFKGEVHQIKEVMARSNRLGMKTFDQALFDLFEDGKISYEDALRNADSRNELRLRIKLESKREFKSSDDGADSLRLAMKQKQRPMAATPEPMEGRPAPSAFKLRPYLKLMADKAASDLFFTPMAPIKIKIEGQIVPVGKDILSVELVNQIAMSIMNEEQKRPSSASTSWTSPSRRPASAASAPTCSASAATSPWCCVTSRSTCRRLDDLGLPKVLKELALKKRGLILMVGATGSGKSTTLAAMINHRNELMSDHIITIEDPIEFLHPNKKSIVNQRELGWDTHSYARALKSAMRAAPDVVLIGEIRDQETMEAAITLAGTGHLAIATLHANNAAETLDRIINMFPQGQHRQVLMDMSHYLSAIIAQRLVIGTDGRRVAAVEVLLNTPHIAELTIKGDIGGIKQAIRETSQGDMQSFDASLYKLYKEGRIDLERALAYADSSVDLEARINFG